jgi:hypothetical protein
MFSAIPYASLMRKGWCPGSDCSRSGDVLRVLMPCSNKSKNEQTYISVMTAVAWNRSMFRVEDRHPVHAFARWLAFVRCAANLLKSFGPSLMYQIRLKSLDTGRAAP